MRRVLRFEVLGPLRVCRGEVELDLGFPQQRALLGLLAVRAGRPVPVGEIVEVLWPERPPASAMNVVRRYAGSLRRLLEPGLPPRTPGRRLLRRAGGYLLEADEDEVDLLRFRALTKRGKRAAATGRSEAALRHFVDALSGWRGPVAMGIPTAVRRHTVFAEVERELVRTTRMATDAALLCGKAELVLPRLRQAVALDPLDEASHAGLVMALAASGLQAEALAAYERVRRLLAEELGVAPGTELTAAHTRVLRQEWRPAGPRTAPAPEPVPVRVPCLAQLPPDPPVFVGRQAELDRLLKITDRAAASTGAPATVLITGMPGIGKTTLAVHWAHRTAERFPDGQLHVRLRGFDPTAAPLDPAAGLRDLLAALGVPPSRMPDGTDALAGLYRSLLAGRRLLVVLDDAADTEQVRPLLPASPGCLTLVTSRNGLSGLTASGAHPLPLDLPSAADARAALASRTGHDRMAAEPEAADEIISLCGRLPLALTIVAARATGRPDAPLSAIATELRHSRSTLAAFAGTGRAADARTAFAGTRRADDAFAGVREANGSFAIARETNDGFAIARESNDGFAIAGEANDTLAGSGEADDSFSGTGGTDEALSGTGGADDALSGSEGTADLRAAFARSYRRLSPENARLFRLLSLHAGPDLTRDTAAALADLPVRRARLLLDELADAHLVTEHEPGRYAPHALLRVFAAELTETYDSPEDRRAARRRLLDHVSRTTRP
ncbi:AAA family ATPase [Streptomyces sp. CA-210063]|uniref:AfsR/SARP family transcriptional regulator n=1 Tax=Streptomyces sp. CA-210063 TaxID=2801029 RepID=UPI00214C0475|nr:BTAD domain-containing putative transcriptional regulator [Streptomyces sp. CA-210063]UUU30156.1 AAA family ATPase [Streptomyces sp. CA-210063]